MVTIKLRFMARLLEHSTQFLNSTLSDQLNGQMSRSTLSKKSQRHFCKWAFLHLSSFFEPDLLQSSCHSIVKLIFFQSFGLLRGFLVDWLHTSGMMLDKHGLIFFCWERNMSRSDSLKQKLFSFRKRKCWNEKMKSRQKKFFKQK